ncbi:hypothetical protein AMECASPLE_002390 [Ameca splendens]|uniref:Scavenger receptor class B member 1 n=1 Tax=Ameca splendens TaxID=208324 RepID=A0ABV0Y9B4_9TELE
MKRVSGITETGKISEVVMPMLWFEEKGYIDGPILTTFHTNLVILPAVMEYMQYIFIALGLVTTVVAILVYYKVKVRIPHSMLLPLLLCMWLAAQFSHKWMGNGAGETTLTICTLRMDSKSSATLHICQFLSFSQKDHTHTKELCELLAIKEKT